MDLFTLRNSQGASVALSSLGAAVVSVIVPDARGQLAEVVVANPLSPLSAATWEGRYVSDCSVEFKGKYTSDNRGEKHPVEKHALEVTATYVWREDNTLELYLNYSAMPQSGIVSPRICLDLKGLDSESKQGQSLYISATGLNHGTAVIDGWQEGVMNEAVVLASASAHRQLNIYTTLPVISISKESGNLRNRCNSGIAILFANFEDSQNNPGNHANPHLLTQELQHLVFYEFTTF